MVSQRLSVLCLFVNLSDVTTRSLTGTVFTVPAPRFPPSRTTTLPAIAGKCSVIQAGYLGADDQRKNSFSGGIFKCATLFVLSCAPVFLCVSMCQCV